MTHAEAVRLLQGLKDGSTTASAAVVAEALRMTGDIPSPVGVDLARPGADRTVVTLLDGTEVDSWSEEWRHECEARYVVNRPSLTERRQYLEVVERKRGVEAADRLRETMQAMWQAKREPIANNNDDVEGR